VLRGRLRLLDVRKHKKLRENISLFDRKTSRNFLELIPKSLGEVDGMLLREVLISSHLFDGQSFDCDKEIHSSDLEMFVEDVTKLKPFLERQIDCFSVRNDLIDKPVQ